MLTNAERRMVEEGFTHAGQEPSESYRGIVVSNIRKKLFALKQELELLQSTKLADFSGDIKRALTDYTIGKQKRPVELLDIPPVDFESDPPASLNGVEHS